MLHSCPGLEEECNDVGNVTRIDNLVKIYPLKTTCSAVEINTGSKCTFVCKSNFFDGNELTYIEGSQENYNGGWTNVTYNPLN